MFFPLVDGPLDSKFLELEQGTSFFTHPQDPAHQGMDECIGSVFSALTAQPTPRAGWGWGGVWGMGYGVWGHESRKMPEGFGQGSDFSISEDQS